MTEPILRNLLRYSLPIHWFWVLIAMGLAIYCVIQIYQNERGRSSARFRFFLILIRSVLVLLVLLSTLNWYVETRKFRKPTVIFLFDDSASLKHLDEVENAEAVLRHLKDIGKSRPSRLNLLKLSASENLDQFDEISDDFEIAAYVFGSDLQPVNMKTIGRNTAASQGSELSKVINGLSASSPDSNLNTAIKQLLSNRAGRSPAALVLVTDGIATDGRTLSVARKHTTAESVPVFVVGLGNQNPARDVLIEQVTVNKNVFVNDLVEFEVTVVANGFAGLSTQLTLWDATSGKTVAEKEVTFGGDRFRSPIRFRMRVSEPGKREFRIAAKPVDQEFDTSNNDELVSINVKDEQIRVLLVYDYPSREFNYLKQFLGRPSVDKSSASSEFAINRIRLDTFLQQSDIEYAATDKHAIKLFPVSMDKLKQYDVIIFGDVKPNWAGRSAGGIGQSELDNLKEFVEDHGGGLIFIAGPNYTPAAYTDSTLKDLFPIEIGNLVTPVAENQTIEKANLTQEFQIRQTQLGHRFLPMDISESIESRKQYRDFRGLFWFATNPKKKVAAQVLAEIDFGGDRLPAIIYQTVGRGSVLYHAFPETHRWRFRSDDTYFGRYWSQMIQYFASAKLAGNESGIEVETDRSKYYRGEVVTLIATVFSPSKISNSRSISASITSANGKVQRVVINKRSFSSKVYDGTISGLSPGSYSIKLDGSPEANTTFEVVDSSRENVREPINTRYLTELANESGGEYFSLSELSDIAEQLPHSELIEIGSDPPWIFWHHWQFTAIFGGAVLLLLSLEWAFRKKAGMI